MEDNDSAPKNPIIIVAVAGRSGAGKTTFAKNFAETYGGVTIISMDSYYLPLWELKKLGGEIEFNNPNTLDFQLLHGDLKNILSGAKRIEVPVYNMKTNDREGFKELDLGKTKTIIIEGIFALYFKELLPLFDIKIFIESDGLEETLLRIERDVAERGRDPMVTLNKIREANRYYDSHVSLTKKEADMIIQARKDHSKMFELLSGHYRSGSYKPPRTN